MNIFTLKGHVHLITEVVAIELSTSLILLLRGTYSEMLYIQISECVINPAGAKLKFITAFLLKVNAIIQFVVFCDWLTLITIRVFEIYICYRICRFFIGLYCQIISHGINVLPFIYSLIS